MEYRQHRHHEHQRAETKKNESTRALAAVLRRAAHFFAMLTWVRSATKCTTSTHVSVRTSLHVTSKRTYAADEPTSSESFAADTTAQAKLLWCPRVAGTESVDLTSVLLREGIVAF